MTQSFTAWLAKARGDDLARLREHVASGAADWHNVDSLTEAQRLVEASGLPDAERRTLQMDLARAFLSFQKTQSQQAQTLLAFGPSIFLMMLFVLGIIAFGIFGAGNKPLLDQLKDNDTARGLITFIFALGVMALALIIVSANFISQRVNEAAFDRAKEVFTSLVAILGTILGFYFGVGTQDTDNAAPTPVEEPAEAGDTPAPAEAQTGDAPAPADE